MTPPAFPTQSATVMLDGPAGPLELAVEHRDAGVAALPLVAIVCHPLPTAGGTMHNKVVTMTARALRELGASTVRFNFRGVGASAGAFDDGNGEAGDLRAVAAWVRGQRPHAALWLAGFSFGAYVSLRAWASIQPQALICIAPPAGHGWDFDTLRTPSQHWLVVQGEQDEIVDPQAVYRWLATLAQPPVLIRMPDAGHFFHRRLIDLRGAIRHAVRPWLPPA